MTILQLIKLIKQIHQNQDNQIVKDELTAVLLSENQNLLNQTSAIEGIGELTPLMYAAFLGSTETVTLLLQYPETVQLNKISKDNYSALDWAFASQTPNSFTIDLLMRAGAKTADELKNNKAVSADPLQRVMQNYVTNTQNTHDDVTEESIRDALKSLFKRYPIPNPDLILAEIREQIKFLPTVQQQVLESFLQHDFMNSPYPESNFTLKQILCVIWKATTDPVAFKDPPAERIKILFSKMIEASHGETGICIEGRGHALIETLDRVHEDVAIIYGNAAVIDILLMRFNRLFNQRLLEHSSSKVLISSSLANDADAQEAFLEYFNTEKKAIAEILREEFAQAFATGLIEVTNEIGNKIAVGPSVYFNQYLTKDDIPIKIPGLQEIRAVEQFHKWICSLSQTTAPVLARKQDAFQDFVSSKMSSDNTHTFAESYQEILEKAKTVYSQAGWIKLAVAQQTLAYFANLKQLISHLSPEKKSAIARLLIGLDYTNEDALNPIFELATPEYDRELFKQTLATAPAVDPLGRFPSPQFKMAYVATQVKNKITTTLGVETWLSEKQLENLQAECENISEVYQDALLEAFRLLYQTLHSPSPITQNKALTQLIALLEHHHPALDSALFVKMLLEDKDSQYNTFMHKIAQVKNREFFERLRYTYQKHRSTYLALNASGMHPIRLACQNENKDFFNLINLLLNSWQLFEALESIIKYHDNKAGIFLLKIIEERDPSFYQYHFLSRICGSDLNLELFKYVLSRSPDVSKDLEYSGFNDWFLKEQDYDHLVNFKIIDTAFSVIGNQNIPNIIKFNTLIAVMSRGLAQSLEVILKHCPDTHKKNILGQNNGTTALHYAAEYCDSTIVTILLNALPNADKSAFLEMKNENEETPLHTAARYDNFNVLFTLLEQLPSTAEQTKHLMIKRKNGDTVLDILVKKRDIELLKRLIALGGNAEIINIVPLKVLIEMADVELFIEYFKSISAQNRIPELIEQLSTQNDQKESLLYVMYDNLRKKEHNTSDQKLLQIIILFKDHPDFIKLIKHHFQRECSLALRIFQGRELVMIVGLLNACPNDTVRLELLRDNESKSIEPTFILPCFQTNEGIVQFIDEKLSKTVKERNPAVDSILADYLTEEVIVLLKAFPSNYLFSNPEKIKAQHINLWLAYKNNIIIETLIKYASIEVYSALKQPSACLLELKQYHAYTPKQITTCALAIAILSDKNPTVECHQTLAQINQLVINGTDLELRQQCVNNLEKIANTEIRNAMRKLIAVIPDKPAPPLSQNEIEAKKQIAESLEAYLTRSERRERVPLRVRPHRFLPAYTIDEILTKDSPDYILAQKILMKLKQNNPPLTLKEVIDDHIGYRRFSTQYAEVGFDNAIECVELNGIIRTAKGKITELDALQRRRNNGINRN